MSISTPLLAVVACAILVVGASGDLVDRLLESDYYISKPASKLRPPSLPKATFKEKWCLVRCRQPKPEQSCEEDAIASKPQYKSSEEVIVQPKYKPVKVPPTPCSNLVPKPQEPCVQLVKSYKAPKPTPKPRVLAEIIYQPSRCTKQPVQPCNEHVYREDQPYVMYD